MMTFKKAIPRRTLLKGIGASVALPLLDSMIPAFAGPAEKGAVSAKRFAYVYVPNGMIMSQWTPKAEGTGYEMTPILEPLAPFRDRMLVLSGLAANNGRALEGEGAGEHARASAAYFTGAHPKKTEGSDIKAGVSADQIAAAEFGKHTQLASLEVALDANEVVGTCDSGYSCAYSNTLCWRTATTPIPMENQPRAVFERLFGDADSTDAAERRERLAKDRSILDMVSGDVKRLVNGLGPRDRAKLIEYTDAIRDVERRIQMAEEQSARELPTLERPAGIPASFTEHCKLMFDLQVLAFQSDMTRVITFMMGREQNTRVYNELGFSDSYHPLSHHQGDKTKIAKVVKIDTLHTQMLAYFFDKLSKTPDGDGTLFDHSLVGYGSALSDGNVHVHYDLPTVLAGGIKGGRHLRYPENTPATNLFRTMLDKLGVPTEGLGDSTGLLDIA